MNYELLNTMIDYIEEHLTDEISYHKLARIVGVSEYSLQRIFTFITGMSISEYIRKRRLSKAFEELKTTDIKIIDLAIRYQYDSAISFSRAFKNLFGITPSQCKTEEKEYKLFPILKFQNSESYDGLSYEMKEIDEKTIYCKKISATTYDDFLYRIRELYKQIKENGLHQKFNEVGQYAVSFYKSDEYTYFVGCEVFYDGMEKLVIPKGKYAVFSVGLRSQKDIAKTCRCIYSKWIPSTNYSIIEEMQLEFYIGNNCFIYVPIIEGKQN